MNVLYEYIQTDVYVNRISRLGSSCSYMYCMLAGKSVLPRFYSVPFDLGLPAMPCQARVGPPYGRNTRSSSGQPTSISPTPTQPSHDPAMHAGAREGATGRSHAAASW